MCGDGEGAPKKTLKELSSSMEEMLPFPPTRISLGDLTI
jgi:hypothetical protein